jgi:uncharacterized Zn finger protein
MITEFDLPCSNCGGQLEQVQISIGDQGTELDNTLLLAKCVECGAEYYPEKTLDQL